MSAREGERVVRTLAPALKLSATRGAQADGDSFGPSARWLKLQKLKLWTGLLAGYIAAAVGAVFFSWFLERFPLLALWVVWNYGFPEAIQIDYILATALLPYALLRYALLLVRYRLTRYALGPDALSLSTGVFILRDATMTYSAVQNVSVRQGPMQRIFGIADVVVQTAGGAFHGKHPPQPLPWDSASHSARVEGVEHADRLCSTIAARAGLARATPAGNARPRFRPAHIEALRTIRDEARALCAAGGSRQ